MHKKFSQLTVIERVENAGSGKTRWRCQCDCGSQVIVLGQDLRRNHTTSCGCRKRQATKHGHGRRSGRTPEYIAWQGMIDRTTNVNRNTFQHYGGRGINVCDEWKEFSKFFADMGNRPSPLHELDRHNNQLGYFKGNCRWATRVEQMQNTRRNSLVIFNEEVLCLTEACRQAGIKYNSVRETRRLKKVNTQTAFDYHLHRVTRSDPQSRLRVVACVRL